MAAALPQGSSAHLPITAYGQGAVLGSRPLQPGGEPAMALGFSEGCSPSTAVLCSLGFWHLLCARKGFTSRGVVWPSCPEEEVTLQAEVNASMNKTLWDASSRSRNQGGSIRVSCPHTPVAEAAAQPGAVPQLPSRLI